MADNAGVNAAASLSLHVGTDAATRDVELLEKKLDSLLLKLEALAAGSSKVSISSTLKSSIIAGMAEAEKRKFKPEVDTSKIDAQLAKYKNLVIPVTLNLTGARLQLDQLRKQLVIPVSTVAEVKTAPAGANAKLVADLQKQVNDLNKTLDTLTSKGQTVVTQASKDLINFSSSISGAAKRDTIKLEEAGKSVAVWANRLSEAKALVKEGIDLSQLQRMAKTTLLLGDNTESGVKKSIQFLTQLQQTLKQLPEGTNVRSTFLQKFGIDPAQVDVELAKAKSAFAFSQRTLSATPIDPRTLLGLPSRDEAKAMGASIAAQMREGVKTENLKAGSATKVDPRTLLGLPSRDEAKAMGASIAAQMREGVRLEQQSARWAELSQPAQLRAAIRSARTISAGEDPTRLRGAASFPQAIEMAQSAGGVAALEKQLASLSSAHVKAAAAATQHEEKVRGMPKHMWEAHSAARGLAGGLNMLWLTYGATIPLMTGAALTGSLVAAAKAGSEFAYQLTFVKALGDESAASVERLGQAALSLSKNGLFDPVAISGGFRVLAQAGLDATAALSTMPSVLQLATVGEMQMEQAATTLVGVMNAFALSVADAAHVGDVFAKAAAISQTSVQAMTEAMKTASVVGEQYGASMEDTAAAITLLAKVNITGTAAGTAFRNMLKELYAPVPAAEKALKQLGVSAKDSQGNLKPFSDVIYELKESLSDFDKASQVQILQRIFGERGSKEAVAMLQLTRREWDELRNSIKNSEGFMEGVSNELENTVKGKWIQAVNTFKVTLVEAFQETEPVFMSIAENLKSLFQSSTFTEGLKNIVSGMAGLTSALVKLAPALITVAEAWVVMKAAMIGAAAWGAASSAVVGFTGAVAAASGVMGPVARNAGLLGAAVSSLPAAFASLSNPITAVAALVSAGAAGWLIWGDRASEAAGKAEARVRNLQTAVEQVNGLFESLQYTGRGDAGSFLLASNKALQQQSKAFDEINELINKSGLTRLNSNADLNKVFKFDYASGQITDQAGKRYSATMFKNAEALSKLIAQFKAAGVAASEAKQQADRMLSESDAAEVERQKKGTKVWSPEAGGKGTVSEAYREQLAELKNFTQQYEAIYVQFTKGTKLKTLQGELSETDAIRANTAARISLYEAEIQKQQEIIALAERNRGTKGTGRDIEDAKGKIATLRTEIETAVIEGNNQIIAINEKLSSDIAKAWALAGKQSVDEIDVLTTKFYAENQNLLRAMAAGSVEAGNAVAAAVDAIAKKTQFTQASKVLDASLATIQSRVAEIEEEISSSGGGWIQRWIGGEEIFSIVQNNIDALTAKIEDLKRKAAEMEPGSTDRAEADKQIAQYQKQLTTLKKSTGKVWADVIQNIDKTFHDGFVRMLEGGKSGWEAWAKSLKNTFKSIVADSIYQMFARPFVLNLVGNVAGMVGANGLAAAVTQAAGNQFSLSSLAGLNKSPLTSSATSFAQSNFGQSIGLSTYNVSDVGPTAPVLSSLGESFQAGAKFLDSYGGYITAAYNLSQGKFGAAAGSAIGTYFGGPLGSIAGSYIGSMLDSAFGSNGAPKSMTGGGARYDMGTVKLDPTGLKDWTSYTELDKAVSSSIFTESLTNLIRRVNKDYVGSAFAKGELNTKGSSSNQVLAAAQNAAGEAIYSVFRETGKGFEDYKKFLEEQIPKLQLATLVDAMRSAGGSVKSIADSVIGTAGDLTATLDGMDAATVKDVTESLAGLADVFDVIKDTIDSKITGEAVVALSKIAGGVKNLSVAISGYYENFYTEAEKADRFKAQVQEVLAKQNLTMPTTLEGFRQYVEALDKTTESGQKAFVALMDVQGAFKAVIDAGKKAQEEAEKKAGTATDNAYKVLQKTVEMQKKTTQAMVDAAKEQVDKLKGLFDYLEDEVFGLQVGAAGKAQEAMSFIDQALTTALSTGYLPDQEDLTKAITAAKEGIDNAVYTSISEQEKDRLILAGKLQQLRDLAGTQLTAARDQLTVSEEQLDKLDSILETAQNQIDALRGIDASVMSVEAAMALLAEAILAEKTIVAAGKQPIKTPVTPGGTASIADAYKKYLGRDPEQAGMQYWSDQVNAGVGIDVITATIAKSAEAQVNSLYQDILGRSADTAGATYWTQQLNAGVSIATIAAAMKESDEFKNSHATGLERVPFDGYQATLHEGEAVIDAQSVSAIRRYFGVTPAVYNRGADSSRTDALIAGLTAEVQRLQALVSDGNREARRTANAVNGSPEQPIPMELV